MKHRFFIRLAGLVGMILLFSGCVTASYYNAAQRNYKQNNYYQSAVNTVSVLKRDSQHKKALAFIQVIQPLATEEVLRDIAKARNSGSERYRWDRIVALYRNLHSLNDDLRNLEPLNDPDRGEQILFQYLYFYDELEQAGLEAAAVYYEDGLRDMKVSDREKKKAAVRSFEKSLEYVPGYKDAVRLMQETQQEALQRVLFLPFENVGRPFSVNVAYIIQDEIIVSILGDPEVRKFTSIVDRDQFDQIISEQNLIMSGFFSESNAIQLGSMASANLIAMGQISQINYNPEKLTSTADLRKVDLNAGVENAKPAFVEAMVQTFTKESSVVMLGMYKVIDMETGLVDHAATFEESVTSRAVYVEYQGDFRALSETDLKKLENNSYNVKTAEEMITDLAKKVGSTVAQQLKAYLR